MSSAGRVVKLEARPAPIVLDTARAAALVIDMQNDFASKGGLFDRAGIDVSLIRRAIAPTARALDAMRDAGIPVIYLKMGYRPDLSDLGAPGSPNRERHLAFSVGEAVVAPDGRPSRLLVRDTWNTDVIDELAPRPGDLALYKNRFSGFHGTELDAILSGRGIRWLVVTGCTTSICVESTIRDAMFRDYSCVLLSDCTAEPIGMDFARTNHEASLLAIQTLFGWVSDSATLARALEAAPPFRRATLEDVPGIERLIAASARGLSRDDYLPEQIEAALGSALGVDTQLVRDGTYFVAEADERLVACGGWSFRKTLFGADGRADREPEALDPARDAARVRAFFVHPDWARRGLGRTTLELCEAEARKAGFASAELMATLPGVRLYQACGYQAQPPIEHPLPGGLSIRFVPMRKHLP